MGFGEVEGDAMGLAEGGKAFKEEREVDKGEGGGDVVDVRHGGSEGAKAVVTRGGEEASVGSAFEFVEEGREDLVENKATKEGAKGAALGKAFMLGEVGPGAVRRDEPAGVGGVVDQVEEGEDLGEVGAEHGAAGVTGAGVEHVDDVEGEEDAGLVSGVREVTIDKEVEEVGDGVKAAIDADAKLAGREEEGSKVRAEVREKDGGGEATPGGADP